MRNILCFVITICIVGFLSNIIYSMEMSPVDLEAAKYIYKNIQLTTDKEKKMLNQEQFRNVLIGEYDNDPTKYIFYKNGKLEVPHKNDYMDPYSKAKIYKGTWSVKGTTLIIVLGGKTTEHSLIYYDLSRDKIWVSRDPNDYRYYFTLVFDKNLPFEVKGFQKDFRKSDVED